VPEYEMTVEVVFTFAAEDHQGALAREHRLRRFTEAWAKSLDGFEAEFGKRSVPRLVDPGYRYYTLPKPPKGSDKPVVHGGSGPTFDPVERHR
jgi:hypothetical protein